MLATNQLFTEDLGPEDIAAIERKMRPGQYSRAGFLGQNESLREVVEADAKVLREHGITHRQVGDRLDSLMGQAFRKWDLASRKGGDYDYDYEMHRRGALVDDSFRVRAEGYGGSQSCPFFRETDQPKDGRGNVGCCVDASHNFTVRNEGQRTEIRFPQLMAHLVRDHHFFEGNTSYRLDPEEAIGVLEIRHGVYYTPKRGTERLWNWTTLADDPDADFFGSQEIIRSAKRQMEIAPGVGVYLRGDEGVIVARNGIRLPCPLKIDGAEVLLLPLPFYGQAIIQRTTHDYVIG